MAANIKFKKGKCYHIRFYDHYVHGAEPIVCETVGWVIREDKTHLYLSWWKLDHIDHKVVSENLEVYGLVKAAMISKKLLGGISSIRLN